MYKMTLLFYMEMVSLTWTLQPSPPQRSPPQYGHGGATTGAFWVLQFGDNAAVSGFQEKQGDGGWINGLFCFGT